MTIQFHDAEEVDALGVAAFLHVERGAVGGDRLGALLLLNARGEPLEFVYNKVTLAGGPLWRAMDREQAAVRRLCQTLFPAVSLVPTLLLCRASEVNARLFGEGGELQVSLPVGRIATPEEVVGYAKAEDAEIIPSGTGEGAVQESHVFWTPARPEGQAAELWALLVQRGFLLEPFAHAAAGLTEVYGATP